MSSHENQIELSPAAAEDLIAIAHYTTGTWGEAQAISYHDKFMEAFDTICEHPGIGHSSTDLPEPYRLYLVGSHVIVYRHRPGLIRVVRVLHQRMSLVIHVS